MEKKYLDILTNIIGAVETGGQTYGKRRYNAYVGPNNNTSKELTDKLRCGNFPAAFPDYDHFTAAKNGRLWRDRSDDGRFLCICLQDSGQYEQSPQRPNRIHAYLLR